MTAPLFYGVSKCRSQQIWRICSEIWTKSAKQQPFMVASDFALLYLIRRSAARFLLPSYRKLLLSLKLRYFAWQKLVSAGFVCLCSAAAGFIWKQNGVRKCLDPVKFRQYLKIHTKKLYLKGKKLCKKAKNRAFFSTGRFLTVFSRGSIINSIIFKMKYRIKKRTINAARVLDRRAGEELQLWQIRSWCPDFTRGR